MKNSVTNCPPCLLAEMAKVANLVTRPADCYNKEWLIQTECWQLFVQLSAKQRVWREKFIFRSVLLVCCNLLPNLMCKLIHNRCKLASKLLFFKTTAACIYANKQSVLFVILCFTSENDNKTINRLKLGGEHWWIFTLTSTLNRWRHLLLFQSSSISFLCIITGRFYGGLKMWILFSPVETENISPLENNIVVFLRYEMTDSERGKRRRTAPSLLQSSHTQQMRVL